jgi:hypothetical protein
VRPVVKNSRFKAGLSEFGSEKPSYLRSTRMGNSPVFEIVMNRGREELG